MRKFNSRVLSFSIMSGLTILIPFAKAQEDVENDNTAIETIVITEGRYFENISTSGTKAATSSLEVPQSLITVTRGQMNNQNSQTVSQALRYSAGVLSDVESTSRNDSTFMRGFGGFGTSTVVASYMDGLKLPRGSAFAQFSIDPFLLERIEVLKGPSSVLYGQVNPGGLVNQISRQPTNESYNEFRAEYGSHNRTQIGIASRGSIDDQGDFQYSISMLGRSSDTRFENVEEDRLAIAPSLTWSPDTDTSLTINSFYINDPEGGYFNSTLAQDVTLDEYKSAFDSELNVGDPYVDDFEREQIGIGYQFSKQLDNLSVYSTLRYAKVKVDFTGVQLTGAVTSEGLLPRAAVQSDEIAHGVSTDNYLLTDFTTGKLWHNLLVGVDYQRNVADWKYSYAAMPSLNVLDPIYNQSSSPFVTYIDSRQTLEQLGLYLQDQIEIDRFRLTLGLRHDWASLKTENNLNKTTSKQEDEEFSYRAGLVYLFDNGIAPYVSYSTSFESTIGVGEDGSSFIPTTARQYEFGVKYQPNDVPLLITASAFDIEQNNTLTPSDNPSFYVQDGQITSQGVELEARGSVSDNFELISSITWLDTKVSESSDPAIIGKQPQAVPEKFASIWASYHVSSGLFSGLNIGGGIRYVSKSYGDDLNTIISPSYKVSDLALRYDLVEFNSSLKNTELTFNVSNLFDEEYYTSCSYDIYCQYGDRREFLFGLKYSY
ncbi:TonB-dependent siderophore receptor [Vibrio sp. WJH972]